MGMRPGQPGANSRYARRQARSGVWRLSVWLGSLLLAGSPACKDEYSGLGSRPAPGAGIVFIGPPRSDARSTYVIAGAHKAAKQLGNVHFQSTAPISTDPAALQEAFDLALKTSAAVICVWVPEPRQADTFADQARNVGIRLIAITGSAETPDCYGHVYIDYPGAAGELARRLPTIAPHRRSYALLHQAPFSTADELALRTFQGADQRVMSMLTDREVTPSSSFTLAIRDVREAFPNVGLIVSLDPQARLAFAARRMPELEELARDGQRATMLATLGAPPPAWPVLQSGRVAALVGPLDPQVGAEAIALAVQAITGVANPATSRVAHYEWITPDTLADFAQRYADTAGLRVEDLMAAAAGAP